MSSHFSTGWQPVEQPEHPFISRARLIRAGVSLERDPLLASITPAVSDSYIDEVLSQLASQGNSERPIASRFQSFPENVRRLVQDDESLTVKAARTGVAYAFTSRPQQFKRPRPLKLQHEEQEAVSKEIERLLNHCQAVEVAPDHDNHKGLLSPVMAYEREVLPVGHWPREDPVPIFHSIGQVKRYNHRQRQIQQANRRSGKPFRDFESGVFCVKKADGGFRLCTDYRELNRFSGKSRFQMEGVQQVAELIQGKDFGMLIDLKDCYLTLGLHPAHRKYCRFRGPDGRRFQWKTVSFGTAEAPQLCTRLLRPIIRILKSLGIRCLIYIDDLLILDQDRERLARSMAVAMELLQNEVGLQLKLSKGQLTPSQHFRCLGFMWNTVNMRCSVPPKRIKGLQLTALRLLRMSATSDGVNDIAVPTRDLARFHGLATSCTRAILPARRRLIYIQHTLSQAVSKRGWRGSTTLSPMTRRALEWWTTEEVWLNNGHDIVPPPRPIQITLRTDAATHNAGYGGVMRYGTKTFRTRGFLTATEQAETHINQFEFSGFENSLWALLPLAVPDKTKWSQVHVAVELDNVTSVKYGRVAVSRSLRMSLKGAKFFDKVEETKLALSFSHIAGEKNVDADELSRRAATHADWKLNEKLFRQIMTTLQATPMVDAFASAQNAQLKKFFSFHHDHRALGTDAFQHPWNGWRTIYAYPPPILLGRVLQKLRADCCHRLVCILPLWMAQTWFPTMLSMLRQPPLLLPNREWIVTDPRGNHSWPQRWPLFAADLSGNLDDAMASRLQFLRTVGPKPRMAIRRSMTAILRTSSNGGTMHTPFFLSVLNTFGVG